MHDGDTTFVGLGGFEGGVALEDIDEGMLPVGS